MSATVVRERNEITLPGDILEAAGIHVKDQVEWRFEDGEIRGRKLDPAQVEILDLKDVDPKTLWPKNLKVTKESISRAIRAERDSD
jgi:bifunctional DNA-binding transcriptional regulator/antitoxin component of YhaV-PrlF toxin-antitoxin module